LAVPWGLPMTTRGGGDPMLKPWLSSRCAGWTRRPGASPPMRMTASWCDPQRIDRIQGCGARSAPPNGELASDSVGCKLAVPHVTSPVQPAMRRAPPRAAASCRRARGRQGRFAPLARWPEDGPSLTAAARAGAWNKRPGRKNGSAGAKQKNWRERDEADEEKN